MNAVAPTSVEMSFSISLRRSPYPGALTAATFSTPRSLFTTSAASASLSTSSEITRSDAPWRFTASRMGTRSFSAVIFFS